MVRKKIRKLKESVIKLELYPEFFLMVGITMVVATLIKLFGFVDFSSDWFWFIAGLGLIAEGFIIISRKHKYNQTYLRIGN